MRTFKVMWTEHYCKTVEANDADEATNIALDDPLASDYLDSDIVSVTEIITETK